MSSGARRLRVSTRALAAVTIVAAAALVAHRLLIRPGDAPYGEGPGLAGPSARKGPFDVPPGIHLPRVARTRPYDQGLTAITIEGDRVTVEGRPVAVSSGDLLPSLHDALVRSAPAGGFEGGVRRSALVAADSRTAFSRIAAVVLAAKGEIDGVYFLAEGLDGRVGALGWQSIDTPRAVCLLALASDGGAPVVTRGWYEMPNFVALMREAEGAESAVRRELQPDAGSETSFEDLLDVARKTPCDAQVCRDNCAPVLVPDARASFGDVAAALGALDSGVAVAWQSVE